MTLFPVESDEQERSEYASASEHHPSGAPHPLGTAHVVILVVVLGFAIADGNRTNGV